MSLKEILVVIALLIIDIDLFLLDSAIRRLEEKVRDIERMRGLR